MKKRLSIIIPVYNEEMTILRTLDEVVGQKIPGWEKEIIVIDDGSTDKTRKLLSGVRKRCRLLFQPVNQGKGAAVVRGLCKAKGSIILIQDADLEYSPKDYPTLLAPFGDPRIDVVYGSRFLGAHLTTMFMYELGNKFVTLITNILYNSNLTDMETGYKVFRREVIEHMHIKAKRFDFEPEFTAKVLKRGYRIMEVPISYFGRSFEDGKKLTWRDGIVAFGKLIQYRLTD